MKQEERQNKRNYELRFNGLGNSTPAVEDICNNPGVVKQSDNLGSRFFTDKSQIEVCALWLR